MVQNATSDLAAQAALLPHNRQKPIWITEWSESASVFWSSHKWSYQYDVHGKPGGDLNLAAGPYPAMTRAQAIETFRNDVVERLRTQPNPVNIGYLLYYSYDSEGKSDMCDGTGFNRSRKIKGTCFNGLIDPVTGDPLPEIALALTGRPVASEKPQSASVPHDTATVPEALINTGRIMPRPAQNFRGWGMSLAWEANDLYGGRPRKSRIRRFKASIWTCCSEIQRHDLRWDSLSPVTTSGAATIRHTRTCGLTLRWKAINPAQAQPSIGAVTLRSGVCSKRRKSVAPTSSKLLRIRRPTG